MNIKMSSAGRWPFCLDLNVLSLRWMCKYTELVLTRWGVAIHRRDVNMVTRLRIDPAFAVPPRWEYIDHRTHVLWLDSQKPVSNNTMRVMHRELHLAKFEHSRSLDSRWSRICHWWVRHQKLISRARECNSISVNIVKFNYLRIQ